MGSADDPLSLRVQSSCFSISRCDCSLVRTPTPEQGCSKASLFPNQSAVCAPQNPQTVEVMAGKASASPCPLHHPTSSRRARNSLLCRFYVNNVHTSGSSEAVVLLVLPKQKITVWGPRSLPRLFPVKTVFLLFVRPQQSQARSSARMRHTLSHWPVLPAHETVCLRQGLSTQPRLSQSTCPLARPAGVCHQAQLKLVIWS